MRGSRIRICVQKTFCHPRVNVSFLAAPDTHHQHVLSHLHHQSYNNPLLHTQDCCLTIHNNTATIHGGVAVPRIPNLPQVVSPKRSSSTGILRFNIKIKHDTGLREMTIKIQSLKIRMNLEKLVSSRCLATSH